ncbi:MAG TPA: type VI secretion system ImpA family N-terminal domain-containing protein, partial [Gemmataceae bacterium]|nr:type VI secretion system ImpA family N-terminal domain-containing protein [Gemmataceae bacterium]
MSAPPVLDIDALLQPIPGPNPAGVPLPDATLRELDELRKEPDPHFQDPNTVAPPPADWGRIIRVTSDALTSRSKDLIGAVRLLEAVTK